MASFVNAEITRLCEANHWMIGALTIQEDHVHLFVSAPPSVSPPSLPPPPPLPSPPTINVPGGLVAEATGPAGAVVAYTVVD